MLNYFRINDPYRLVIIFILLLLFRLPFLVSSGWDTVPELKWMIIGERMNEGVLLYVGIWDDIGPLSAWMYRTVDFLFGRSQLAFQIMGLLLFFFQIFYMNYIALKHKMFNENNYLPALFYGILGLSFFNVITLSPQLLGMTFVLISLNSLFNHIEARNKNDGNLLNIGLYIGISSLFYLPLFITIFIHVIGLLFFTNTIMRRYLLLLYGVLIPFIITWLIYLGYGKTDDFFGNYIHSLVDFQGEHYLSFKSLAVLTGTTAILFIISAMKILSGFGFTVFQVRIQKTMFFAGLVALAIYVLYTDQDGYSFVLFFPWIAFFLSHFFLSIRHKFKREISFLVYFLSIVVLYIGIAFQFFNLYNFLQLDPLIIHEEQHNYEFVAKKTLILGPDIKPYFVSMQATPYFNWNLSKNQLTQLDYYDNLEEINRNIRSDMPEYILDQVGLAPKLFDKIPLIAAEYRRAGDGLYKRVEANN